MPLRPALPRSRGSQARRGTFAAARPPQPVNDDLRFPPRLEDLEVSAFLAECVGEGLSERVRAGPYPGKGFSKRRPGPPAPEERGRPSAPVSRCGRAAGRCRIIPVGVTRSEQPRRERTRTIGLPAGAAIGNGLSSAELAAAVPLRSLTLGASIPAAGLLRRLAFRIPRRGEAAEESFPPPRSRTP